MECDWNNPGTNPYTGDTRAAIVSYGFSDLATAELLYKINKLQFDTVVYMTNRGLKAPFGYASSLRDMHWGKNTKCVGQVNVSKWADGKEEKIMVYCVPEGCIAIPQICHNIAKITYFPKINEPDIYAQEFYKPKPNTVPEPSTIILVSIAIIGLLYVRQRKNYK